MEQKKKEKLQAVAEKVAAVAFGKAELLNGWRKWLAIAVGVLAAGAAAWILSSCAAAVKQDSTGLSARWIIAFPIGK